MIKVVTLLGTRPEIIRLSETIKKLDQLTNHVLVFTGQSHSYEMGESFFSELGIRKPDYYLTVKDDTLGKQIGNILKESEAVFEIEKPDSLLVLGDTNSALSCIIAKRMHIPVFHMEAGNRCFDDRVPEEQNRRIVDHTSDINMCYTEHARRYLLREGFTPDRVFVTGSPLPEVYNKQMDKIDKSDILERLGLESGEYYLASVHREENVMKFDSLKSIILGLGRLGKEKQKKVIMSTHPRTKERINGGLLKIGELVAHDPFGMIDYIKLQKNAICCLSDSGTIHEDAAILGIPAVNLRDSHERPEVYDEGNVIMAGVDFNSIMYAADVAVKQKDIKFSNPYGDDLNCSDKVSRLIMSYHNIVRRKYQ